MGPFARLLLVCFVGWLALRAGAAVAQDVQAAPVAVAPLAAGLQPDTLVGVSLRARRVGVSTFAQQSAAFGLLNLGARQTLRYRLFSEWVYDTRGAPPFVLENYHADVLHLLRLGRSWQVGQQVRYDESRANHIRTASWLARVGWQHRLRPTNAADTVSTLQAYLLGGLTHDLRNGIQDVGPTYGAALTAIFRPLPGLAQPVSVRLSGTRTQLGPRTWERAVADSWYEHRLDENATAALRLGYRRNRAEDYLANNVQRIQSDTAAAQLTWAYQLGTQAAFRSDNTLLLPTRSFRYRRLSAAADTLQNVGYEQYEVDTRQDLTLTRPKLQAHGVFGYHERARTYALRDNNRNLSPTRLRTATDRERIKDVLEKTTLWQGELTWLPTPKQALSISTTAQLLRVNTPSEDNNQDRDEASHQLRLTLASRWHPTFRTSLALWGEYRQFVFIKAEQSAENYTDRLLHWEPGFTWAPGPFSWRAAYHLWVSYQVRDRPTEAARNRANRVLELEQHLSYQLTPRWLATADYQRRENRIGLLRWPQFTESPLDTTIVHDVSVGLRRGWSGLRGQSSLRAGYRFLEQRTHNRAALIPDEAGPSALIYLRTLTRQHGPELAYERRAGALSLTGSLWLQSLQNRYRYRPGQGTYAGASYTAEELRQRSDRLLPYFELLLEWQVRRGKRL
ncbi:hypothetical protein F0P96_13860 [Hymenobacter busanensis]|uniref:Uncharacterized protein n=1 Tax=Hymenobacter busanensis TaxID=2607656 RepID=A0A7L4ZZX3_9BACT|nr:hypothetical protein [Hymenobacter busanensis]KAA9331331.1 hypothetical protein F0P96_13860 [Hymenobacter busanensis]QHJ08483.1 hypothetical protein GUY19_14785 [Hymenobacter busanensis]